MIEQDRIEFERWWNSQPSAFKKLLPSMEASNLVWVEAARKTRAMCTSAPLPDDVARMVATLSEMCWDECDSAAEMIERLARQVPELEQQRNELLVALEATVEAIRLFRNEPQLERLVSLRATAGYVAMDAAMDRGTDAIDAARGVK